MSEPTRARYPDKEGWVVDDHGVEVFYEVCGDASHRTRAACCLRGLS